MSEYLRVEENEDLARDKNSQAIINTNKSSYDKAVMRSKAAQKQRDEIRSATREINTIKNEMHDIKSMIKTLLDRN